MTAIRRLAVLAALIATVATVSVSLLDAGAAGAQTTTPITIPIAVLHGPGGQVLVVAPVAIQNHLYLMLLDTGASSSLIDTSIAKKLHLRKAGRSQPASGVFGGGSVSPVRVSRWQLGPLPLPVTKLYATHLGVGHLGRLKVIGLLGSDILSRFGRIQLDYAAQALTVGG